MTPEQILDVGIWMVLYLLVVAVGLYGLLSMSLVAGKLLPSIPLDTRGHSLSWKGEEVMNNPFVHMTVAVGMWVWMMVIGFGAVALLGALGILLGVPIPG